MFALSVQVKGLRLCTRCARDIHVDVCAHSVHVYSTWRLHLKQLKQLKAALAAAADPEQTEAESGAAELLWREACSVRSVE